MLLSRYLYWKVGHQRYKNVIFWQDLFQIGVYICRKQRFFHLYTLHHTFNHLFEVHFTKISMSPKPLFNCFPNIQKWVEHCDRPEDENNFICGAVSENNSSDNRGERAKEHVKHKENADYIRPCRLLFLLLHRLFIIIHICNLHVNICSFHDFQLMSLKRSCIPKHM